MSSLGRKSSRTFELVIVRSQSSQKNKEILVTVQRPNSPFPFFDLTLGDLGLGLELGLGLALV